MTSPAQRTLAELRRLGWRYSVSSWWNSFSKQRADLCGFADVIALDPENNLHWIQYTVGSSHAARRNKIEANEWARSLSMRGKDRVEVWSWSLRGKVGKRKLWTLRVERGFFVDLKEIDWNWIDVTKELLLPPHLSCGIGE